MRFAVTRLAGRSISRARRTAALERHAGKAGRPHHVGEGVRARETANRFDEIAVRRGVAGDGAAERWDHVEGIELVKRIEARQIDAREFKAQEAAADPQHAVGFGERGFDPRYIANAEGDGDCIVAAVGERQRLGIALDEGDGVIEAALSGARPPDREHIGVDVGDGRTRAAASRFDDPERNIAGAAGEIEQRKWRRVCRGLLS
jgi:hypothetical protein